MTTITISDDEGQLTLTMDGEEPMQLESVEQACQAIEQAFSTPEEQTETTDSPQEESAEQAFAGGFEGVRGNGING